MRTSYSTQVKDQIFRQCQKLFPEWTELSVADFDFDDPKGFSSFTMGIRSRRPAKPAAVLYRRLEGKDNAILDYATEKEVFLTLGDNDIAAHCYHYDDSCRIEAAPLVSRDRVCSNCCTKNGGRLARRVLEQSVTAFPENEQSMCEELRAIYSDETRDRVRQCLPAGTLSFCHNDTYHGNIMKLDDGRIKLVDFEFSCLNHKAYDFASLFAETVMRHGLSDYPYFEIAEPEFGDHELGMLIDYYLDNTEFDNAEQRTAEFEKLLADSRQMLIMSDYKYAMAALPLALNPIQKIRFIPYAYQRFHKFLRASDRLLQIT
jgi:hypothetical protein